MNPAIGISVAAYLALVGLILVWNHTAHRRPGMPAPVLPTRVLATHLKETPMISRDDLSRFQPKSVVCCGLCADEKPLDISMRDYSAIIFGRFEKAGEPGVYFQLWCNRHDCNVLTIYVPGPYSVAETTPLRITGCAEDMNV